MFREGGGQNFANLPLPELLEVKLSYVQVCLSVGRLVVIFKNVSLPTLLSDLLLSLASPVKHLFFNASENECLKVCETLNIF